MIRPGRSWRSRTPSKYPTIKGVITFPDGREICDMKTVEGRMEYHHRTCEMIRRQNFRDPISGDDLYDGRAQFDHQAGRTVGKQDDRIEVDGQWINAALRPETNSAKGSRRYAWISVGGEMKYLPVSAKERP